MPWYSKNLRFQKRQRYFSHLLAFLTSLALLSLAWCQVLHEPFSSTYWKYFPGNEVHVAIAETWGVHDEVLGAMLHTLSELPEAKVTLFRDEWRWDFDQIIAPFWDTSPTPTADLWAGLQEESDTARRLDYLFLTSCDFTLEFDGQNLLNIWDSRHKKFRVGCLLHDASSFIGPKAYALNEFVRRNAMDIFVLSPHVARGLLKERMRGEEANPQQIQHTSLSKVNIDYFVPLFPVELKNVETSQRLTTAVVQGNVQSFRRNYQDLFFGLEQQILEDPELFGYEIPPDEAVFLPKSGCKDVFHLKILGEGELGIPNALKHVVIQRSGALYPDYIAEVGHSDLLVPAFAHDGYILSKASSSVGMALTAKIPLLLAKADLRAYSFLDSRVTFLRNNRTEAETLADLRRIPLSSWSQSIDVYEDFQKQLFEHNRAVFRKSIHKAVTRTLYVA